MAKRFFAAIATLFLAVAALIVSDAMPWQSAATAAPACFYQICYDNCVARGGPKRGRNWSVRPWATCAWACRRCRTT
jgi:hypothetical protein